MSWLSDTLGDLGSAAQNHPDLMAALPVITGAVLSARNGRLGGPLGAGLLAGGSLMALRRPQTKALSPIGWYNPQTKQIEYTTPTVGQPLNPPAQGFGLLNPPKGQQAKTPKMETWFQIDPSSGQVTGQKDLAAGSPAPGPNWFSKDAATLNANITNRAATNQRLNQFHQDMLANEAANRASTAALKDATLAQAKSNQDFLHAMATSREQDQRLNAFNLASDNLSKQRDNIATMVTKGVDPTTIQAFVARYNSQAASLAKRAPQFGADPTQFTPLNVNTLNNPGVAGAVGRFLGGGTHTAVGDLPAVTPAPGAQGPTATDPRTGKKVMLKNGKWVPIN